MERYKRSDIEAAVYSLWETGCRADGYLAPTLSSLGLSPEFPMGETATPPERHSKPHSKGKGGPADRRPSKKDRELSPNDPRSERI